MKLVPLEMSTCLYLALLVITSISLMCLSEIIFECQSEQASEQEQKRFAEWMAGSQSSARGDGLQLNTNGNPHKIELLPLLTE